MDERFLTNEQIRQKRFNEFMIKNNKMAKKGLIIAFSVIGILFSVIGTIFTLTWELANDYEMFIAGIVFVCVGALFLIIVALIAKFYKIKDNYDYNKYKDKVYAYNNKYGGSTTTYENMFKSFDNEYEIMQLKEEIRILKKEIEEIKNKA